MSSAGLKNARSQPSYRDMDKLDSVMRVALEGVQTNLRRLHEAAHEIATAPVRGAEPADLAEPLVRMLEAQRAIEASAAVMRRADETLDGLLEALRS